MKLILIKHGETLEGRKGTILGQLNGNLSPKGRFESRKIAEAIKKNKQLNPVLIISSDLKRTKQTAQIISKFLHLKIHYDKLIRERRAGNVQGKLAKDVDWESYEKKPLALRKHLGGESFSDVRKRAKQFLKKIKDKDNDVLVVSHSVFILMLIAEFYKMSEQKALKLPLGDRIYAIDSESKGKVRSFMIK